MNTFLKVFLTVGAGILIQIRDQLDAPTLGPIAAFFDGIFGMAGVILANISCNESESLLSSQFDQGNNNSYEQVISPDQLIESPLASTTEYTPPGSMPESTNNDDVVTINTENSNQNGNTSTNANVLFVDILEVSTRDWSPLIQNEVTEFENYQQDPSTSIMPQSPVIFVA